MLVRSKARNAETVRPGRLRTGLLILSAGSLIVAGCGGSEPATAPAAPAPQPAPPVGQTEEAPEDDRSSWPSGLNIGTSSQGTSSYTVGAGLADLISRELGVSGTPLASGFGTNISLVAQGEAQIGMAWPYSMLQAILGEGSFEGIDLPMENVRMLSSGTFFPGGIVVLKDSEFKSISDLRGKRIFAERTVSPDTTAMVRALLEGAGLMDGDYVSLSYEGTTDAVPALASKQVEGFGFLIDPRAAWATEADQVHGIRILGLTEAERDAVLPKFPWLSPGVIPAGVLSGQDQPAYVVQDQTIIIVRADLPDSLVYALLDLVVSSREELGGYHPTGAAWFDPEVMLNVSGVVPYHEGAIKYYQDKGLWSNQNQADHELALARLLNARR